MSLSDYAGLKAEVIKFAGRDDLSDSMDTFISMAEEYMYSNEDQPLRISDLEAITTLVTVAGVNSVALPSTYLEARSLSIEAGGAEHEMRYYSPSTISKRSGTGVPSQFTVTGDTIVFDIAPDSVYNLNLTHYSQPVALDATNDTNAVLTKNPTIYLFGCLSAVYDLTSEPEDAEYYYSKMLRQIKGAIRNDRTGLYPSAQERVRGSTP